jgi:CRP-like cAMP-binding protein
LFQHSSSANPASSSIPTSSPSTGHGGGASTHSSASASSRRRRRTSDHSDDDSDNDSDGDHDRDAGRHHRQNECGHEMMEVGRGDTFGETAIFPESEDSIVRRQATAVCVRDSELVRVSHTSFLHIFSIHPTVMLRFSQHMSKHLLSRHHQQALQAGEIARGLNISPHRQSNVATIAIIPVGDYTRNTKFAVPHEVKLPSSHPPFTGLLSEFATRLSAALSLV